MVQWQSETVARKAGRLLLLGSLAIACNGNEGGVGVIFKSLFGAKNSKPDPIAVAAQLNHKLMPIDRGEVL